MLERPPAAGRLARLGRRLALAAAGAGVLLGLAACHRSQDLDAELHAAAVLEQAVQRLAVPLRSGDEAAIVAAARSLFDEAALGFSFLAVFDAEGLPRASLGRYENLRLPLIGTRQRAQLRERLYRLTSRSGSLPVNQEGERLGSIDFALLRLVQPQVERRAVQRLQQLGALVSLLSLALLIGLWLHFRRSGPAAVDDQLRQRLDPVLSMGKDWEGLDAASPLSLELLGRSGLAVIVIDAEARILRLNALAESLSGWRASEAERRLIYSVFHALDEDGQPLPVPAEQALVSGNDVPPQRCQLRPRQGFLLPIEMQAAVIRREAGGTEGAVLMFRDLREVEQRQAGVRARQQLVEALVDRIDEALLTVDLHGRVRYANAVAQALFGYREEEMLGVAVTKLMPVPFLNLPDIELRHYHDDHAESTRPRVMGWRRDATTFPVDLQVRELEDGTQMLLVRDASERRQRDNLAHRLHRLLEQSLDEIYVFDAQTLCFLDANPAARQSLGFTPAQLRRMTPLSIAPRLQPEQLQVQLSALRGGQMEQVACETEFQRADGSRYPVEVRLHFSPEEQPPVFVAVAVKRTSLPPTT
jgi:PAS domain S-box-containing protein